jgi:hypothetical protein
MEFLTWNILDKNFAEEFSLVSNEVKSFEYRLPKINEWLFTKFTNLDIIFLQEVNDPLDIKYDVRIISRRALTVISS